MNMISDPRRHLVVIGNGMAGMRTVEELLKWPGGNRYRITVHMPDEDDADDAHTNVWTSTDRTAGRSLTMGAQLSPESADT